MPDPIALHDVLAGFRDGSLTARALAERCLDRIAASELGAWLALADRAHVLAQADAADAARAAGDARPLLGVPVGIKDNLVTTDLDTTCASRLLAGYRSPFESTASQRLRDAGAIVLGKTNMDAFGMGGTSEQSAFGPVHNPHDPTRSPGGSSGGSAAAVAAGECVLALGSDTGGSVRQPAAFTGVVGIKPSYGRVSRWGLVAFASSLDQVGTFGVDVASAAAALDAVAGHDLRDATSLREPMARSGSAAETLRGATLGVPRVLDRPGVSAPVRDAVQAALAALEAAGATLRRVDLPHLDCAVATYYLVATAEASSNLARFDGLRYGQPVPGATPEQHLARTRGAGFGREVKRRILLGTYVLSAGYADRFYARARRARTLIAQDWAAAFAAGCDAIALPTAPTTAPRLGAFDGDPVAMYLADVFTVGPSLAGLPALSLPCGSAAGLPVGLQLVGPALGDAALIGLARAVEGALAAGAALAAPGEGGAP